MNREGLRPSIDVKKIATRAGLASIAASSLVLPATRINADATLSTPKAIIQNVDSEPVSPPVLEFQASPQATITATEFITHAEVNNTPVSLETPSSTPTPTATVKEVATTLPTETAATEAPIQEAVDQTAESRSNFAFILEGDEISNKELYSRVVYEEIKTPEMLKTHIEQIKGDGHDVPEFDPENQIAFIAALTSENYKPAFKLEGMKEVDGEKVIALSYTSQTINDEEGYSADERNSYVIGVIDKPADDGTVLLQTSFVGEEGPFMVTTLGGGKIDGGFTVTIPGLASGNIEQCFGTSMTEIREMQKQFPTADSVEFHPQYDKNGTLLGWSWNFVAADGERFAWNGFAKDPSCEDSRPAAEGDAPLEAEIILPQGGVTYENGLVKFKAFANDKNDGASIQLSIDGKDVDAKDLKCISGVTADEKGNVEYAGVGCETLTPLTRGEHTFSVVAKNPKGEEIVREVDVKIESLLSFFERSSKIVNKEGFLDLQIQKITSKEAFEKAYRRVYGDDTEIPAFNPETQTAFFAGRVSSDGNPTVRIEGISRGEDGRIHVEISDSSQDMSSSGAYDPSGRSDSLFGIVDVNNNNLDVWMTRIYSEQTTSATTTFLAE